MASTSRLLVHDNRPKHRSTIVRPAFARPAFLHAVVAAAALVGAPSTALAAPSAGTAGALGVGSPPLPSPKVTEARISLKADGGFYDDAWALETSGKRLALIHTDRDDFQRVEIFDLETKKTSPSATFDLSPPARAFEGMSFLPDGSGLLLVSAGPADTRVVESMDFAGRILGRTAPAWGFGTTVRGKDAMLVTLDRVPGREGELTYVAASHKFPDLKVTGKPHSYLIGRDGSLRAPALMPVAFFDGYSKLLAQRPGWYDKKKDARQPDAQSVLDLLSGKPVSDGPIDDVYGWARTTRLRREHPNRTAFVQLADTMVGPIAGSLSPGNTGKTGVELVDPAGKLAPLPLAVPFRYYDRFTLKDQEGPAAGIIHFALQVDPVNPDAVARQKADTPMLDVYVVPIANPSSAHLRARVVLDAQPVVWVAAGDRVVVQRRFKSFARGGDRVDVFDLAP